MVVMSAAAVDAEVPSRDEQSERQEEQPEDARELGDNDADADAEHEVDDIEDSKPRKKRRIIKLSDKKFDCPRAYME